MTSAQKASLAELVGLKPAEAGAQVNKIETVKVDGVALNITDKAVNVDLSGKVDKAEGKSLIADTEITRLAGMETGAQANVIESIKLNGALIEAVDKCVNIAIPAATASALGLVKVDDETIEAVDGVIGVKAVGISKVFVEDGVELVMNGGNA